MFSETDECNGLIKTYWVNLRERVYSVAPTFAKLLDNLNLDKSFPLWLAYYRWGDLKGDTISPFLPTQEGGLVRLTDPDAPREVIRHLGYGNTSSPMGMVLEKNFELFIDLQNDTLTLPWDVYSPGKFFSFNRALNKNNQHIHETNSILSAAAGTRSIFLLPHIGSVTQHVSLQRDYNIKHTAPKSLYEHWSVLKEIAQSPIAKSDWRACLVYFPEKFLTLLHTDSAWLPLKTYLHELSWQYYAYTRNRIYYEIAFSMIQKKRHLKPNPYLADTASHLLAIAMGEVPGYVPACDNNSCPIELFQSAFVSSYGLKKYIPNIMLPAYFNYAKDKLPTYYSLQYPSIYAFSPNSRKTSSTSTLFELRELEHLLKIFIAELSQNNAKFSDVYVSKVAKNIECSFYHNENDPHNVIKSSDAISKADKRFLNVSKNVEKIRGATFASDAKFVRGCIAIRAKN